jgi:hypothetical protein
MAKAMLDPMAEDSADEYVDDDFEDQKLELVLEEPEV